MQIILTAFTLFLFVIICGISFLGGFLLGRKKRPTVEIAPPTEKEKAQIEKERRELENFLNYTGVPQNNINGFDR